MSKSRWKPEMHDPLLLDMHRHGLSDEEITGRMLDDGYPVAIEDVRAARLRLGLKANKRPQYREPKILTIERPNPLTDAKIWLGKRLEEKKSGYFLDGVPSNLTRIMRAYNRMRKAAGAEQIVSNANWRVE